MVIDRIYNQYLLKSLKNSLITVLIGPRQAGKTTSISIFLDGIDRSKKIYLNLDSSFERDRIKNDENYLEDRIEETLGFKISLLQGIFYVFIDEAQKIPLIFEKIKILYDRFSDKIKFIVSGSSSLELLDKTAETLAGRVQILRVYPFTLSEASMYEKIGGFECAAALYHDIFSGVLDQKKILKLITEFKPKSKLKMQLIDKLLTRSLFPPTFSKINEQDIPRWLVDYIDTYIERDMRSVRGIGDIEGYRKIVIQLAVRMGGLLEYNQLGNDAGVNQITTKKYVSIWQESLIGFLLQPFFVNPATRIKKSKKVYFFDNALVWALAGFKGRKFIEAGGEIGHYFENLIITDFIKWGINADMPPSYYFWEKSSVSEIDLVLAVKGMTIPVEIKYSDKWDDKYLHALDMFKEKHARKSVEIPFSLIIYRGDFIAPRKDVFCLPVWALC